jgi:ureidoacrylate peracid hydrolase
MSKITIEAKSRPIEIDLARTAVLVIDLQNDFGAKGGIFDSFGIPLDAIHKAVDSTAKVLTAARKAGLKAIYLKMGFKPDYSDMGAEDGRNRVGHMAAGVGKKITTPDGKEGRILIRDTWNTEVLKEVAPQPGDIEVWKARFTGFYETELDATLKKNNIKYLIVTGCTTSVCVESTVRDAMFHDYHCVVLSDCTAEPIGSEHTRSNHDASLTIIAAQFGHVSDSAQFIKALPA